MLVYCILALLVFGSLTMALERPSAGEGKFMGLVMLEFLVGLFTASLPAEILTKPFSYCLPGHRAVPRKFVFWVGILTSIPGALVFLAYPRLNWWQSAPVICGSAFCACLVLYWLGVGLIFGVKNSALIAAWIWLPVCGVLFFDPNVVAERVIVSHPVAIISLGLSSSVAAWLWLGNPNWARRLCAISRMFVFDAWNRDKMLEHARRRQAAKPDKSRYGVSPWVERFFAARMRKCSHTGPGRYIWGGLYASYGMSLSRWQGFVWSLLFLAALAIYFSYSRPGGTNVLFFMAGIAVTYTPLPVYSCMTTAGGRRERFFTAIALAGTITLLITAVLTTLTALSVALAPIMPEFTLRGMHMTFHATSLRLLIVPSIIIPIVLAIRLIIYKKPFTTFAAVSLLFALVFVSGMGSPERFGKLFNPVSLACLLIVSWLVLVIVLRHICFRRSLTGQSRTY